MKRYDFRKIMKKAWSLVKNLGMSMSSALKEAKSLKAQLIGKITGNPVHIFQSTRPGIIVAIIKNWIMDILTTRLKNIIQLSMLI